MSEFKLVGLVPLKGCSKKFLKNLVIGEKYCFYQQYEITLNEDNSSVDLIQNKSKNKDEIPFNLYNSSEEINISVSALVGENGSGKSSLIELFYYVIYFIGTRFNETEGNHDGEPIIYTAENRIQSELNHVNWFLNSWKPETIWVEKEKLLATIVKAYQIDTKDQGKKSINDFILEKLKDNKNRIQERIRKARSLERQINSRLNVAIVYETDKIQCIQINNGKFKQSSFENGKLLESRSIQNFNFKSLFYSISVNYSHHSLNSNSLGEWINALFHKNDGYQTPVVINPMRKRGNFDVNLENKLLKERLIGNVTYNLYKDPNYKLLNKYRFEKFIFTPKRSTGEKLVGIKPMSYDATYFDTDPIGQILKFNEITSLEGDAITEKALAYLDKKVFRLPDQYPFLFKETITQDNFDELVAFIKKDRTHITKKINQTIYFLNSYGKTNDLKQLWISGLKGQMKLDRRQMIQWLKSFDDIIKSLENKGEPISPYYFSLFSMPGFMNVDFEITDVEKGKTFKLSELSSGEQQIILNLSSISYHLNNLQSIHGTEEDRMKYKDINIFLDEIELYYHPNSQRKMVQEILTSVKEISKTNNSIQSVNILFSTHSPFILSDIPNENILRLENGKPSSKKFDKTFGSNIHDLLASNFFLSEGFMGEFATDKIKKLIMKLQDHFEYTDEEKTEMLLTIELIGEAVLRNSLLELYRKKFSKPSYRDLLDFYDNNQDGANK